MAKVSVIEREKKRIRIVRKYQSERVRLKKLIQSSQISDEERLQAIADLQVLPRNSSPCRLRNRCVVTGRPRGFYRKFGLSRNKLREHAMNGDIPGLVKASW